MAARLMQVEGTEGAWSAKCSCGWRSLPRVRRENAHWAADQHRAQVHPRQAIVTASMRRWRAVNA